MGEEKYYSTGETIKVHITEAGSLPGRAFGYLADGTRVLVIDGDLCFNQEIQVSITEDTQSAPGRMIIANWRNVNEANEIIKKFQTERDELVPTTHLKLASELLPTMAFRLEDVLVFPSPEVSEVVRYLIQQPELWNLASINVSAHRTIFYNRAPLFGVDFQRSIEIAINNGSIKSHFIVPKPERHQGQGFFADMLIRLSRIKAQPSLELESWQVAGFVNEVFYIHAILSEKGDIFKHLDGAIIEFTEADKFQLFQSNKKVKGESKRKHFRLDGEIDRASAFDIARCFLPHVELVDEYFLARAI